MRRLAVTALILVAAAVMAAAALGAVPELARPKATVRVKSCSLEDKTAVFYARMRKLHGTKRMRMRFSLLERAAGTRHFKRVHAPGLSRWRKSAQGVHAYGYSQEVRGLHDDSAYRMRVRYRWYDKENQLQRSARRTSKPCRMFVPLPNLRVRVVDVSSGYVARVTNTGQASATNVGVQLRVDRGVPKTESIANLDPQETQLVAFDGPACRNKYVFRVDPADSIPETNEDDNRATRLC